MLNQKEAKRYLQVIVLSFIIVITSMTTANAINLDEVDLSKPAVTIIKEFNEDLFNSNKTNEELRNDIKRMKKDIFYIMRDEKIETDLGINVYRAETTKKIHLLSNAIINTDAKIRGYSINRLISDKMCTEADIYNSLKDFSGFDIIKEVNKKDYDFLFDATIDTINSLRIDPEHLKRTDIFISPFKVKGVRGFAYSYSKHIVIANYYWVDMIDSKDFVLHENQSINNEVKETILHELGHVFHKQVEYYTDIPLDENLKRIYNQRKNRKDNININKADEWDKSISESFAEDFKVFFSRHLGENSFRTQKRTIYKHSPEIRDFLKQYVAKPVNLSKENI